MGVFPARILVATDGSEDAARATAAASDLAGRAGSELHVVHVWHDVPGFAHDFVKSALRQQGRETLDEQVEQIEASGGKVAGAHLRGGRTSNEIIALSDEIGAGLLIVGSRGLGTVQRILMGSHSEEIVHHSHIPVLVLRGEEDAWPPSRVVIGEDFSDDARRAGDLAARIGALYDAGAVLLYAQPDLPYFSEESNEEAIRDLQDIRNREESLLEERADGLEALLGRRPEIEVADGYPASVLLDRVQGEGRPAFVAVGSRGLAGIRRTRLGSVSTKVVTASHGPVLVVPHVE